MDELAVIDIYRELEKKYHACYDGMTKEEQNELGLLLKDLKKRARAVGIDVDDAHAHGGEIDKEADYLELVAISKTDDTIRNLLRQELQKAKTPPSKRVVFELIQVLDKYYAANVDSVSTDSVRKNLEDMPTYKYFVDKDALVKAFQDSASDAIKSIIQKGEQSAWKTSIDILHKEFDAFFKNRKELLETSQTTTGSDSQLSIGLKQKVFFDRDFASLSGSAGLEFLANQNDWLTYKNHDGSETFEDFTASFFKQSVNTKLSNPFSKDFAAKYATTLFTFANTTDLWKPIEEWLKEQLGVPVKFTYAFKGGSISGGNPFVDKNKGAAPKFGIGITLFTFQIKLQILTTDALKKLIGKPDLPIKKLGNCDINLSLAIKWLPDFINKLDDFLAKKVAKVTEPKPKNKLPKTEKDALKDMRKYAEEIDVETDKIAKGLDKKKGLKNTAERLALDTDNAKAAKKIRDRTQDIHKAAQTLKTPGGKALGKEIIEETGEKILKKLGTRLAGKVILKFIPGVNVISTAVDLIELGVALYSWWSNKPRQVIEYEVDKFMETKDTSNDLIIDEELQKEHSDGHRFKFKDENK